MWACRIKIQNICSVVQTDDAGQFPCRVPAEYKWAPEHILVYIIVHQNSELDTSL